MPNRGGRSSVSARLSECVVGDESGTVVLTATGEQGAQSCCVSSRWITLPWFSKALVELWQCSPLSGSVDPQSHSSKWAAT